MIFEAILLSAGAGIMGLVGQGGSELAKNLTAELSGGAIERGMDALLGRIRPEGNQDCMRAIAAALKQAIEKDLLKGSKILYDHDREICQALGRDAETLFVQPFGDPQKVVRDALLVGTEKEISKALEDLFAPYFDKARDSRKLKCLLPPAFLYAFAEIVKDEKYEKGWKAFQRDLAWAMHQQLITLNKGQGELLARLKAMHEGKIEVPGIDVGVIDGVLRFNTMIFTELILQALHALNDETVAKSLWGRPSSPFHSDQLNAWFKLTADEAA